MLQNFIEWANNQPGQDPFVTLHQKPGDRVYFGVHDLSRFHKKHNALPNFGEDEISHKIGTIVDADPIDQTVTVETGRDPYHYGYKKLEDKRTREKRQFKKNQLSNEPIRVEIPVKSLQQITYMLNGKPEGNVWLVIDGNTKYQDNLVREIRKKVVQQASQQMPQQPPPQNTNPYQLQNRHVINNNPPDYENDLLDIACFVPSKHHTLWKYHNDNKIYEYVPE